jgi:hypothetical protein
VTRPIRFTILAILSVTVVVAAVLPFLLPPRASHVPDPEWIGTLHTVRGAYHVHSTISDGTGSLDEIGAAGAAAGLEFVIVTDHGDGTRRPEPARYRSGVLVIEAVEINTSGGHLVALGIEPSPYPLAGTPRAVLEDVHRLGGFGIAAHPGSPRLSLQWTDWNVPLNGIEWLNADSEWRDEFLDSLGRMLLTYPFRPAETLASMLDRPDPVMARWDQQARAGRMVGLAGADAHARLGLRQQDEPYEDRWHLAVPSYQSSFMAFSTRVVLDAELSGDAERDAAEIIRSVRKGRVYSVIDGIASRGALDFRATNGATQALPGDELDVGQGVDFHLRVAAPAGSRMVLLRNGEPHFETMDAEARVSAASAPGAYRVEVYAPAERTNIPWLVSNPIYVGMREVHRQAAEPSIRPPAGERGSLAAEHWTSEASPGSTSRLKSGVTIDGNSSFDWEFSLQDGTPAGQFAAVSFPVAGGLVGRDRVQLRARANQPMRAWVQVRASSLGGGDRWGQSFYLDSRLQPTDLFFEDFVSLGPTSTPRPPLDKIDSLLLVVDTVNTRPGTKGAIHIAEAWLTAAGR